jgi:hypothetical protein
MNWLIERREKEGNGVRSLRNTKGKRDALYTEKTNVRNDGKKKTN